jgi:hypothetical protein
VIGSLPHEDIKFCAKGGMNYLLIALTSDTTQQQLESITPDYKQLLSLISPGTVRGVIVSTKGEPNTKYSICRAITVNSHLVNRDYIDTVPCP